MSNPSRRDLIAAFLGGPALAGLSGCGDTPLSLPPGELIGPSVGVGHRLRDGWRPVPAADAWEDHGTVIVGGGVAGLGAAWRLARAGVTDFVMLELEPELGGTARGGSSPVGGYPWGAHYIPAPLPENRLLITLLDEMSVIESYADDGSPVVGEQYLCREPQERVFFRGRWYEGLYLHAGESPDDKVQRIRFEAEIGRWAGWRDAQGRRAFAIPFALSSDDPAVTGLDRMSMADWLDEREFTSPRLRWLVDYACRDDYGTTPEHTSAWAGVFYFAARVRDETAPSQPLITWPEGNARLVAHLASSVVDRVRTGWAATDIVPIGNGDGPGRVHVTAVSSTDMSVRGLRADRVVFAAPQFLAKHLVRPFRDRPPAHLSAFDYGAWMVANLHLSDRPRGLGFPLAWDNVLYESPSLGYVVNTHQRGIDYGPAVLTYYYPLCDDDPTAARSKLLSADRDGWADVALTDLGTAHPDIRSLTTQLDVMRWGHAMIRPKPEFIWGGDRAKASIPFRNIHFAGADLSGLPLFEEAFYHGVRAAEEVLTARGRDFDPLVGRPK